MARHQAEEAAAHSRRALEGALFTLFPVEGKWPSESPWAAMQQVKIRNGFAVKLGPALQRLDARMAKREAIVLRDSVRASISVPVWQEEGTGHMAKTTRAMLAEVKSYRKPPSQIQSLAEVVPYRDITMAKRGAWPL